MDTLLLNLAYACYVGASLFPGGLKLRIALVVQAFVFIAWAIASDHPSAIVWNLAFAAVNGAQAIRILRRSAVALPEEEEALRQQLFDGLSAHEFLTFWSLGRTEFFADGEQLLTEATPVSNLMLLLDGTIVVRNSTGLERERTPLSFVGEMSYISGEPASADVIASGELRCRTWSQANLTALLEADPALMRAVQHALSRDVAHKLRN